MNLTKIEAMVKAICLELLAQGRTPTGGALMARIPGSRFDYLAQIRNRLASLGEIPPLPDRVPREAQERRGSRDGLLGRTPEERAEIKARRLEVQREKRAGEGADGRARPARVFRHPFATGRRASSIRGNG